MLTIYFTRHGETEWNKAGKMQGWGDSPLTKEGERAAYQLNERLKDTQFDNVYTSPSGRTLQTAKIITGSHHSFIKDDRLKEINLGTWEGKTKDEVIQMYSEQYVESFWKQPHLYEPEIGESFCDVEKRVNEFLTELKRSHHSGNVLLVTHTVIVKMILKYFHERSMVDLWTEPYTHPTCLNQAIIYEDGSKEVLLEGCLAHTS